MHCFTRGLNGHIRETWQAIEEELIYSDAREKRIFCFSRYQLSFLLPEIAKQLDYRSCFHTGKGNFFTIELSDQQEYEIYFKVSKSGKGLLRLFIESAYVRDKEHSSSRPKKKKISFFVIAYHVQSNQPIKLPPQ